MVGTAEPLSKTVVVCAVVSVIVVGSYTVVGTVVSEPLSVMVVVIPGSVIVVGTVVTPLSVIVVVCVMPGSVMVVDS